MTVILAVIGALPVFVAVNGPMVPVPLASSPIEGLSFIQAYVAPETLLDRAIEVDVPGQTVWEGGVAVTCGIGLTVTTTSNGVPGHPL